MSIINSDNLNTNWQLNVLKGLQLLADKINKGDVEINQVISELQLQTNTLADISSAFNGTFEVNAYSGGSIGFPYILPDLTYTAVTVIIPAGETLDLNTVTLPAGTYNFSGEGNKLCKSFTLDNPSNPPGTNIVILTVNN